MKILDIHPKGCWSYEAKDGLSLLKLRDAASLPDQYQRELALGRLVSEGSAYSIPGDPTTVELADKFFDEVNVTFHAAGPKGALVDQNARRWIKPTGRVVHWCPQGRKRERPLLPLTVALTRTLNRFATGLRHRVLS